MENYRVKFKISEKYKRLALDEKEAAKIDTQIYSSRKSLDSPGDFGLEGTGKINSRII